MYLPIALSVALRPLFPFQQAQYAQVFRLKPAPFCTLFAGLGSTNKAATFLLQSDSCSVLSSVFPFTSISLTDLVETVFSLLLFYQVLFYNESSVIRFSWGMTRLMSWPDSEHYLCFLQSFVVFLLLSLVSILVFSRTGGVLSHRSIFDTQVSSISTEELVLPRHARCVLSRLRCNGHSLLLSSYLSRIGRIENPSCSARGHSSQDTSHLILHCPATDSLHRSLFGGSLSSLRPLVQALEKFPSFWGSMVFHHAPIPRKGSGKQQQQQQASVHFGIS